VDGGKARRWKEAGAIKQIAIMRLSEIKNFHYPLSSFHCPLFAIFSLLIPIAEAMR